MFKRLVIGFVLLFLAAGLCWAWEFNSPWYSLERGKRYFRNGSFGNALIAFEDARRGRYEQFTQLEQDLILFLSRPTVRLLGDSLEFVEAYIAQFHETRAAAALAELYHRVPRESLRGSVRRALEEMNRLKVYPEAEFWLGETFRETGELGLALRQYEEAWNQRAFLENPQFEVQILYRLAEVHRVRLEYPQMERRARQIIEGICPITGPRDRLWGGAQNPIRPAMLRLMQNEGIDRFLALYRHNNPVTERAHRFLGSFFYVTNRFPTAVEHLMFAFLIQNTILIDEIIRRQFDFTYTTLDDLMEQVGQRRELRAFIEETEYFRTIFMLSSALHATGNTRPAMELWAFLARSPDSGEWGERARRNPTPFIDRAVEQP